MKSVFGSVIVIGFLLLAYSRSYAQTPQEYEVPIQFSITQTGINRFIASQWAGIQTSWSGSYQGLSYSLQLKRPTVSLADNTIKLLLELEISSPAYSGTVGFSPTLTIPSSTVSAGNIIAQYTNLRQQIDAIAAITDPRLRDVIEQKLVPIDWIAYQGMIFDQGGQRWIDSADIRWTGLPTLTFSVANGELFLTLTPKIQAAAPDYLFVFRRPASNTFGFRIVSNNAIEIAGLYIYVAPGINILSSPVSAPSRLDVATGKHIAEIDVQTGGYSDPLNNFEYRVLIKRRDSETLWRIYLGVVGVSSTWIGRHQSHSSVTVLHGE